MRLYASNYLSVVRALAPMPTTLNSFPRFKVSKEQKQVKNRLQMKKSHKRGKKGRTLTKNMDMGGEDGTPLTAEERKAMANVHRHLAHIFERRQWVDTRTHEEKELAQNYEAWAEQMEFRQDRFRDRVANTRITTKWRAINA